jgi:hypothetical protein
MSFERPEQLELQEFAQLWASRVAAECPFLGARVTVLVRPNDELTPLGRGAGVAPLFPSRSEES